MHVAGAVTTVGKEVKPCGDCCDVLGEFEAEASAGIDEVVEDREYVVIRGALCPDIVMEPGVFWVEHLTLDPCNVGVTDRGQGKHFVECLSREHFEHLVGLELVLNFFLQ